MDIHQDYSFNINSSLDIRKESSASSPDILRELQCPEKKENAEVNDGVGVRPLK